MTTDVRTWAELADGRTGEGAAVVALARLLEAQWFCAVGQVSNRDHTVDRVARWPDANEIFRAGPEGTYTTGILDAPSYHLLGILDAEPSQATATAADAAARNAVRLVRFIPFVPDSLSLDDQISVGDYLTSYIRFLFLEIYAEALGARCTYFRDQLGWFVAGFFPCGWVGAWPDGRMRVF